MIKLERNALVWGVVGNLGGGKTLTAVSIAVQAMNQGYFVCSNITFDVDRLSKDYGKWITKLYKKIDLDDPDFDPFALPQGDPRGSGGKRRVLIILDEVAEWFDQYSSANKDPRIKRLWSWLRHSSKRSQDVFIICQRQEYINKVVRILIARWIWVDDLAVWRCPIIKIKLPFCSGLVAQNVFDRQGNRIGAMSFIAKVVYGRYYNTAECLNKDGSGLSYIYDVPDRESSNLKFYLILYILSLLYLVYNWYLVVFS